MKDVHVVMLIGIRFVDEDDEENIVVYKEHRVVKSIRLYLTFYEENIL